MKKFLVLVLLVVAATAFGQFRGYTWGTQRVVVLKENPWLSKEDCFAGGQDPKSIYFVGFFFLNDGRLARGVQSPTLKGSLTAGDWIDKYEEYQQTLESKYGKPTSKQEDWTSDSAKLIWGGNRGNALSFRDLKLTTFWTVGDTSIQLSLINTGDMFDKGIDLYIAYRSLTLGPILDDEATARKASEL